MQVNSIGGYYTPKTNFNNQVKMSKPISFGEDHWCGGAPDYQKDTNIRINGFFEDADSFTSDAKGVLKYIKKLALIAYSQGEESDFKGKDGRIDVDGVIYDVKCTKGGKDKTVQLNTGRQNIKFYFNKDTEGIPKEYTMKAQLRGSNYEVAVSPDETSLQREHKYSGFQKVIFNKEGSIYEAKDEAQSHDYKKAITRKFPNKPRYEYEENTRWSKEDVKETYAYNSKTKNWVGKTECINLLG